MTVLSLAGYWIFRRWKAKKAARAPKTVKRP